MRGPPHTPQTQCSFGPLPFGSTRATAPQCGHAFAAPLVKPHEEHTPSTTVARLHAEQLDGGGLTTEPANYSIGPRMRAFAGSAAMQSVGALFGAKRRSPKAMRAGQVASWGGSRSEGRSPT